MAKTKDKLANELYGYDFSDLEPGEKASVTKKFNAQPKTRTRARVSASSGTVLAKVGRLGNGVKECALEKGADVEDLIDQADFSIDTKKEKVVAQSTGLTIDLSDKIKSGETYIISPEIKSA